MITLSQRIIDLHTRLQPPSMPLGIEIVSIERSKEVIQPDRDLLQQIFRSQEKKAFNLSDQFTAFWNGTNREQLHTTKTTETILRD